MPLPSGFLRFFRPLLFGEKIILEIAKNVASGLLTHQVSLGVFEDVLTKSMNGECGGLGGK